MCAILNTLNIYGKTRLTMCCNIWKIIQRFSIRRALWGCTASTQNLRNSIISMQAILFRFPFSQFNFYLHEKKKKRKALACLEKYIQWVGFAQKQFILPSLFSSCLIFLVHVVRNLLWRQNNYFLDSLDRLSYGIITVVSECFINMK